MTRNTRIALGTAVAALAVAPFVAGSVHASTPSPSSQCVAEKLPLPDWVDPRNSVWVADADPSGRYVVGQLEYAQHEGDALLWLDGEVEAVLHGFPHTDQSAWVEGVNGDGVVVGSHGWPGRSWTYQNGTYTLLQNGATVEDINENGDILGQNRRSRWLIWSADDPENPRPLAGGEAVEASAISDQGVVVGSQDSASGDRSLPVYWPEQTAEPQRLELPGSIRTGVAIDVAGDWVIGIQPYSSETLRWNLTDGTAERLPGTSVEAVNSAGDYGDFDGTIYRADGSTVELPAPADGDVPSLSDILEPGSEYAAAGKYYPADNSNPQRPVERPVVWRC